MWVKLDDGFPEHPKVLDTQYPPLLIALQVAGICYCNRNLTDGFMPRAKVAALLSLGDGLAFVNGMSGMDATWEPVIADLLRIGVWEEVEGGYRIHDYLEYQPSRDEVEGRRNAVHQQKVDAGKKRASTAARAGGKFSAGQNQHNQRSDQHSTSPVPVPKEIRAESGTERSELVKTLARYSGWSGDAHAVKQEAALRSDFPTVDLLSSARSWAAWAEDAKKPPINCWSSFRNWVKKDAARPADQRDDDLDYIMRKWR